jgi:hypothetical protein
VEKPAPPAGVTAGALTGDSGRAKPAAGSQPLAAGPLLQQASPVRLPVGARARQPPDDEHWSPAPSVGQPLAWTAATSSENAIPASSWIHGRTAAADAATGIDDLWEVRGERRPGLQQLPARTAADELDTSRGSTLQLLHLEAAKAPLVPSLGLPVAAAQPPAGTHWHPGQRGVAPRARSRSPCIACAATAARGMESEYDGGPAQTRRATAELPTAAAAQPPPPPPPEEEVYAVVQQRNAADPIIAFASPTRPFSSAESALRSARGRRGSAASLAAAQGGVPANVAGPHEADWDVSALRASAAVPWDSAAHARGPARLPSRSRSAGGRQRSAGARPRWVTTGTNTGTSATSTAIATGGGAPAQGRAEGDGLHAATAAAADSSSIWVARPTQNRRHLPYATASRAAFHVAKAVPMLLATDSAAATAALTTGSVAGQDGGHGRHALAPSEAGASAAAPSDTEPGRRRSMEAAVPLQWTEYAVPAEVSLPGRGGLAAMRASGWARTRVSGHEDRHAAASAAIGGDAPASWYREATMLSAAVAAAAGSSRRASSVSHGSNVGPGGGGLTAGPHVAPSGGTASSGGWLSGRRSARDEVPGMHAAAAAPRTVEEILSDLGTAMLRARREQAVGVAAQAPLLPAAQEPV